MRVASMLPAWPAGSSLVTQMGNCRIFRDDPQNIFFPSGDGVFVSAATINAADAVASPSRLYLGGFTTASSPPLAW